MTEPPEGPSSEDDEGPRDEDLDVLDDDMLLDRLGGGEDDLDTGELPDLLGAWRDDVESVPPPPGTDPETIQQIHDFTQEVERATTPPRAPDTGGTPRMSINEDAAALAAIATNGDVQGGVLSAQQHLSDAVAALQNAKEALEAQGAQAAGLVGGAEGDGLNGQAQAGAASIDQAISAIAMFDGEVVMGPVNNFYNAVSDAAQRHGS